MFLQEVTSSNRNDVMSSEYKEKNVYFIFNYLKYILRTVLYMMLSFVIDSLLCLLNYYF